MAKVMQKVLEAGEPTVPDVTGARAAHEADAPSGFVPTLHPSPPPTAQVVAQANGLCGVTLTSDTATWDPARIDPAVIAFHDRQSAICEQFRSIRARLLSMNTAGVPQVIVVTSSVPQEGKNVSTINLAMVMAEGGEHSILIADADFRRASIARMLGLEPQPGLAEVLRGEIELTAALRPTPLPNLKVIPAGVTTDPGCTELLGGPTTRAVLDALRATFDFAFLDTPPVTTVSDVSMLAPHCDGTIVVVEMGRTPEPTVQQAVRSLQTNNVKILGCILARCRDRRTRYYDRYYSYYPR